MNHYVFELIIFCNISLYFGFEFSLTTSCCIVFMRVFALFCFLFLFAICVNRVGTPAASPVAARLPTALSSGFAMRSLFSTT